MKKLFAFVLGLLLYFCPLAVQAQEVELMPQELETTEEVEIVEEIVEAPTPEPMTEEEINTLLGEDPYIGETDWRGNKVSTKRDYSKKKGNRPF